MQSLDGHVRLGLYGSNIQQIVSNSFLVFSTNLRITEKFLQIYTLTGSLISGFVVKNQYRI